jgi:beta-1,4-mannosyl-glycoprotein beta-1,4-N-acetylglucosaminyltransferase
MKTIDCIIFNDEKLLLDLRFNILNNIVDFFVVCESSYDHHGKKKKANFSIGDYPKFKNKIIYFLNTKKPPSEDPWQNQAFQRNLLIDLLHFASDDDFIIYSDVDEIPNPEKIKYFINHSKKKFGIFLQKYYYYKLNLLSLDNNNKWEGSKICKKKNLTDFEHLRTQIRIKNLRYKLYRIDKMHLEKSIEILKNGGWHFSFLMKINDIINKIQTYSHSEFNKSEFKNKTYIKNSIKNSCD